MITIREYKKVQSLEEAYELNQKKSNRIIGGMIWLKMETLNVGTAIDLSDLGLDAVEETETEFRIGAMTTLRTLETHEGLAAYTNGAMRESVRHIVGVQLRNLATLGGSLYSRFGFSDVLTMFLALDASVELYKGGIIFYSLGNFLFENDTTTHQPADFYEKYHMSNTSMVGEGMAIAEEGSTFTQEEQDYVRELFSAIGQYRVVPQKLMNGASTLTGCGPAFIYLIMEGLADGAVYHGVPRQLAYELAAQTVIGAGKMLLESGLHPGALKDNVCSPGGTTIRGIRAMEDAGVRAAMIDAIDAASHNA